jgi:hypothetical protein
MAVCRRNMAERGRPYITLMRVAAPGCSNGTRAIFRHDAVGYRNLPLLARFRSQGLMAPSCTPDAMSGAIPGEKSMNIIVACLPQPPTEPGLRWNQLLGTVQRERRRGTYRHIVCP